MERALAWGGRKSSDLSRATSRKAGSMLDPFDSAARIKRGPVGNGQHLQYLGGGGMAFRNLRAPENGIEVVSWYLEALEVRLTEIVLLDLEIRLNREDRLFPPARQCQRRCDTGRLLCDGFGDLRIRRYSRKLLRL
jgi:hypothetical protein